MKRYLITGALSLVVGGFLTGCHETEDMYDSIVEQKLQTYEQVFKQEFGEIAPDQDWGFGQNSIEARTRMNRTRATGEFADRVGAYPDANMWTSKGFLAPEPLTPGQKLRVQFYFQTVKNPGGIKDYGQIDFFMQQVYDGGDDPITNYNGYSSPAYSLETYLAANGTSYITSGEHMDHLTAGPDHTHIFNFNNGTCSTNPNVANRDQTDVNNKSQQHSDQIMLMLNTKTSCFGYANSDDSYRHDNMWRLVSYEVIDKYCDETNASGYQAFLAAHSGITDDKVTDEFKRSFIGFDFDMLPDDEVFAGTKTRDSNGKITHIDYDYFSIWLGSDTQVWNGTALVDASTIGQVVQEEYGYRLYPYVPGTTQKVKMVSANTNEYCGTTETWTDADWEYEYRYTDESGVEQYGGKKVSVAKMLTALADNKLPKSSSNKDWVKIGGCADGYYSDWIVSFLPAEGSTTIITETYQTYTYAFEDNRKRCDFDLNDVVLQVKYHDSTKAQLDITLVAAGCQYDNYVYLGSTKIEWAGGAEVHDAFGVSHGEMVNTGRGPVKNPVTKIISTPSGFDFQEADFKIVPYSQGADISTAQSLEKTPIGIIQRGNPSGIPQAPVGIVIPYDWKWPKERVNINDAYKKFAAWGKQENVDLRKVESDWYLYPVSGNVYSR